LEKEVMEPYPLTLPEALEDWLNHDPALRLARAERLRTELKNVEPEFKRCTVRCYRRMDFPKDPNENPRGVPLSLLNLLHTGKLLESISSWTTDPNVAKAHLEGVQPDATCVIFAHDPSPEEVWVNLSELLTSPKFTEVLRGGSFPAISYWMTKEKEVILEVAHVTPEDVYAWGGFAGTLEQLRAAAEAEGKLPEEINSLESHLRQKGIKPGQEWWLSEKTSKDLALRMQGFARQRYVHPPPKSDMA
jgi:hypothetical protein